MKNVKNLLVLTIFLTFCSEGNKSPLIDQHYLESSEYKNFEQEYRKEIIRKKSWQGNLADYLRKLGSCKESIETPFPTKMDQKEVTAFIKSSSSLCEQTVTPEEIAFNVRQLKEVPLKNYVLKWILLEDRSLYIDWRLLAVTFRNGNLVDYKRVGVFKKNPSKNINTLIKVSKLGDNLLIKSTICQKIIYPFEQKSTVSRQFIINSKGNIQNNR